MIGGDRGGLRIGPRCYKRKQGGEDQGFGTRLHALSCGEDAGAVKACRHGTGVARLSDNQSGGDGQAGPHDPQYALAKAAEMRKRAEQATGEEDRQAFRALAEQWERLAKVAQRPHI
jgi:hypothetical protein